MKPGVMVVLAGWWCSALLSGPAGAQTDGCPRAWTPGWTRSIVDRQVKALTVFDLDGGGPARPALLIAGDFYSIHGVAAPSPVAFDGTRFASVRAGLRSAAVRQFAVLDADGPGPLPGELYAAGAFAPSTGLGSVGVVRWTLGAGGQPDRWTPVGTPVTTGFNSALGVTLHDFDGAGPELPRLVAVADGNPPAGLILQWNGTAWVAVGTNNRATGTRAVSSVDHDGPGPNPPQLYAIIGNSAPQRLNGTTWVAVTGLNNAVESGVVFDLDGAGPLNPRLVVTGSRPFMVSGRECAVAAYDGASWSAVGGSFGFTNSPNTLLAVPGAQPGSSPSLLLSLSGSGPRAFRWNSTGLTDGGPAAGWAPLSTSVPPLSTGGLQAAVYFDADGSGPEPAAAIVGGDFRLSGGETPVGFLARVDGAGWRPLARFSAAPDGLVLSLKAADVDGPGPGRERLYVGGAFQTVRGVEATALAAWDGRAWSTPGRFTSASPTASRVGVMTWFDDDGAGPRPAGLYVGGYFDSIDGRRFGHVARLDASGFSPLGAGFDQLQVSGGTFGNSAMLVADLDGPGPEGESLLVAGGFNLVDGRSGGQIAAWNGSSWRPMGAGAPGEVLGMAAFPRDGEGPLLVAVNYRGTLATWNGTNWQQQPNYFSVASSYVYFASTLDDDGDGPLPPYFLVGGAFDAVGGVPAPQGLARFDGTSWTSITVTNNFSSTFAAARLDLDGLGPEPARTLLAGTYSNTPTGTMTFAQRRLEPGGGVSYGFSGDYTFTGGISGVEAFADEPGQPPAVYIGGNFSGVGLVNVQAGVPAAGLARFGCAPCVAFATQPAGRRVAAGASVTLESAALVAAGDVAYQWRRDGEPLSDGGGVSGSRTATLRLERLRAADAGRYDVLASAPCGGTLSASAVVEVSCPADLDGSGALTIEDLHLFIQGYFAQSTAGDANRDFRVTVQDLFDFLAVYLGGC